MSTDRTITLTEREIWFIECAIELKDAVLPLHKDNLDAKTFKADYGVSKSEVEKAISNLKKKIKK